MYLTIIDYSSTDFPEHLDAEVWVSDWFGLDNVYYMTSVELQVRITTLNEVF